MVKYGRTATVLTTRKPLQRRKLKAGQFANLSKTKREKIGIALIEARKQRMYTRKFVAALNDMSEAQITRNERGEFGVVQDVVIIKHLISLGLTTRGVLE